MTPKESIEQEICDYLDGGLPPHRMKSLETRLAEDSEAMELLCLHSLMVAGMRQPLVLADQAPQGLLAKWKRNSLRISLASAAAVALIATLVLHQIMVAPSTAVASIQTAPGTVFSLQTSGSSDQDGKLDIGETMVVSQGTAEITLPAGNRCVAEAPARVTLQNEKEVHLSHGRAFFEIAKGSEGFVVTTKELKVVDLGTAFTIDDRSDHPSQVHVVRGKVRATTLSGRRESSELVAGEAAAVGSSGTLRPIPANGDGFFHELPTELPSIRFTFDPDAKGKLSASGTIAKHEDVRMMDSSTASGAPTGSKGIHGGALIFTSPTDSLATTWRGIGGSVPRTISLWVRVPEGSKDGSILGWGLRSALRGMSDIMVAYSGEPLANLRLSSGRRWLQTARRLDDGRWHHVSFLIDSPEGDSWPDVKCFVDGVREPMTPRVPQDGEVAPLSSFGTVTDDPDSLPLTFGSLGESKTGNAFTGELDEVVITAGILTEAEIIALSTPSK